MTAKERLEFHSYRASVELHVGLTASNLAAARSHLNLSALHFQRVRQLQGTEKRAAPLLVM